MPDGFSELVTALNGLTTVIQGGVQITTRDAEKASIVYQGFVGSITGTTPLSIWDPPVGSRWKLKGAIVTAIVSTILAAADEALLYFSDSGDSGRCVAPIGGATAVAIVGTIVAQIPIDLREGRIASVSTSVLQITTDISIGTGVIKVAGVVFGEEVSD